MVTFTLNYPKLSPNGPMTPSLGTITKGIYAKMARGEMVRYMAEHGIEEPEDICSFDRLGYVFRKELSSDKEIVFERIKNHNPPVTASML